MVYSHTSGLRAVPVQVSISSYLQSHLQQDIMDGPALSLPASIALPSLLAPRTTTQGLSGNGASGAVTRPTAGFHRPPILYCPEDRYGCKNTAPSDQWLSSDAATVWDGTMAASYQHDPRESGPMSFSQRARCRCQSFRDAA